jgi:hypothetical protein
MGIEVVLVALAAWAVSKARTAGKALDGIVDAAIDAGASRARDKVRDVVLGKLETDSAIQKLAAEVAETGDVSERTRRRVTEAIEDAADCDPAFAASLQEALSTAEQHPVLVAAWGGTSVSGTAAANSPGSIAIGAVGRDAIIGQPQDPRQPDRV